ncbi:hypothetical protein M8542_43045 [Amycolatopsis sp. OK19-0408]|uniref:Repeat domain-containing protein n=1 Tax=Amycolatopsis iheyensis TaxID=2945988 RepID=A0A9X2NIW7_9PSEU|nr:hypothetical protein [Amycolatopsis iheyensis]MCR6489614.1 hypothetical protein [Amycolatopsis iheyensis]
MSTHRGLVSRALLVVVTALAAVVPPAAAGSPPPLSVVLGSSGPANAAAVRLQNSTARSRDVTGDGWPDLIARQPDLNNGTLWIYPHTRNPQGAVFGARVLAGTNWNTMNWIGVAELTGDTPEYETSASAPADLLARRTDGTLFVYPHSGALNGKYTWGTPVTVGTNWNIYESLMLADINTDGYDDIFAVDNDEQKIYFYLHTGTFDGKSTFRPRQLFGDGYSDPTGTLFFTEWSREDPDLGGIEAGGLGTAIRHTHKLTVGAGTWDTSDPWTFTAGQFAPATTQRVFLMDVNGDGKNDVVKATPTGTLVYYPFNGWKANPALGTPRTIGTGGWQAMDLLT